MRMRMMIYVAMEVHVERDIRDRVTLRESLESTTSGNCVHLRCWSEIPIFQRSVSNTLTVASVSG